MARYVGMELRSESDVEQKVVFPLLTSEAPLGLGFQVDEVLTKIDIRRLRIGKGNSQKLYYPDYIVVVNGHPALVVEVKGPGEDILEAAREARLYASELNSRYKEGLNPCAKIIATNGSQLIASSWDTVTYDHDFEFGDGAVAREDFANFLEAFCCNSLTRDSRELLDKFDTPKRFRTPAQLLGGKSIINQTVGFNDFGSNVSLEYQHIFNPEKPMDRRVIAENAYVASKQKLSHVGPLDKIIRAAVPPHEQASTHIRDSGDASEIIKNVLTRSDRRNELCLLIGSVGSGKSTFTEYLRRQALPKDLQDSTEWVRIDLNKAPLSRERIYNWIVDKITTNVKAENLDTDFDSMEVLYRLYASEISKLRKGKLSLLKEDSPDYNLALYEEITKFQEDKTKTLNNILDWKYLTSGKTPILILDNSDKGNRDDQLLMFEVANWLKETFPFCIFLPLRDTTFDLYHDSPPLDTVIKDLVFRIDPPLLERVITKRIKLIQKILINESFKYTLSNGIVVNCTKNEVIQYIQSITTSLFHDSNFSFMVKGIAGRNIRKGIEILIDFCKSGHIHEEHILKMRTVAEYQIPTNLVYMVLLKGNRKYYKDQESDVINLFHSLPELGAPDLLLRLDILNWLKQKARVRGPNDIKGYHKIESLLANMAALGHKRANAIQEIGAMVSKNCISTEDSTSYFDETTLVTITPKGHMQINIVSNVNYLATVAEDTYFGDEEILRSVRNNMNGTGYFKQNTKEASLDTAVKLTSYLSQYRDENHQSIEAIEFGKNFNEGYDIGELADKVGENAKQNRLYANMVNYEKDFPLGTREYGIVVSIQNYGFFVEFEGRGTGLVHTSQYGVFKEQVELELEESDIVEVEILEYSNKHERLSLRLIALEQRN